MRNERSRQAQPFTRPRSADGPAWRGDAQVGARSGVDRACLERSVPARIAGIGVRWLPPRACAPATAPLRHDTLCHAPRRACEQCVNRHGRPAASERREHRSIAATSRRVAWLKRLDEGLQRGAEDQLAKPLTYCARCRSRSAASAIAARRSTPGAARDILLLAPPEAARVGQRDGAEGRARHHRCRVRAAASSQRTAQRVGAASGRSARPPPRRSARTAARCRGWCCSRPPRRLARTAASMRSPTPRAGRAQRGGGRVGAGDEQLGVHAVAGRCQADIAGLARAHVERAGAAEGGWRCLPPRRHARRAAAAGQAAGAAPASAAAQRSQQVVDQRVGDAEAGDPLQALPGGHAVDLDHLDAAAAPAGSRSTPA